MKALVYTTQAKMDGRKVIEPGKCELLDIPEPQLLPTDDMKIRVDYCAMCATDVHIVTMGLYGMPAPWIMGHELCGTIVEVNPPRHGKRLCRWRQGRRKLHRTVRLLRRMQARPRHLL